MGRLAQVRRQELQRAALFGVWFGLLSCLVLVLSLLLLGFLAQLR
jgi:hypothetical protein